MYVDAEIDTGSPQAVLSVPESAVLDTGSRLLVGFSPGSYTEALKWAPARYAVSCL